MRSGRSLFGHFDAGCPVDCGDNLVVVLQELNKEVTVELHVLDDQDLLHRPTSITPGG